uniref:BCCT family transporter n=1 Tax=Stenotrophomonas sp. SrG TaxID=3414430 RepID=UPI003CF615DB
LLQPRIGAHHRGWSGPGVNGAAVGATAIGVATTLGVGTIQIAAGLDRVFGLHAGAPLQLTSIAVAFGLDMASTASGVPRGVGGLSN